MQEQKIKKRALFIAAALLALTVFFDFLLRCGTLPRMPRRRLRCLPAFANRGNIKQRNSIEV
jgi:hypothetical protein